MSPADVHQLVLWAEVHWWISLFVIIIVFATLEEIGKAVVHAIAASAQAGRERRLELAREIDWVRASRKALLRAQGRAMAQEDLAARPMRPPRSNPGPCVHRNVKQIRTADGELTGWLCQKIGCEERLPPNWAVADEDLPAPGSPPPDGWTT